jgi:hypothetical protein
MTNKYNFLKYWTNPNMYRTIYLYNKFLNEKVIKKSKYKNKIHIENAKTLISTIANLQLFLDSSCPMSARN